ncbi:uncharacterized protein [Anoplolepis gracilipes]|uniref:uncharacterized protein isoform X3 n=1 Tax=Anoplolepis gracilipes TaxID=354296 RepID=UPI003BA3034A
MNFVGNEFYKLNQHLLVLVGLWPYDNLSFKYYQRIFCNITIAIMVVCQTAKLITFRRNINLILKLLPPVVFCFICIIKYQTFYIVAEKVRYLMDHVEQDWNMLKDKKELEIIEKYTYIGSMCTLGFTMLTILISTESLYVTHVLHACGMFQIASYRMNRAFDNKLLKICTSEKRAIIVCKGIIEAVYIHKRAIEFSEFLWSTFSTSYCILLVFGITSLLINLFCLFQAVLFMKGMNDIIILIIFNFGHFFYLFLGNYVGQILIDHSVSILENIYIARWYGAPLQAQRLLPIIMQRSMRSCKMVVGGMFVPSYEGFAAVNVMTYVSQAFLYINIIY